MKQNLKVSGMTCSACKIHVEKALNEIDGVKSATVNLGLNEAHINYDETKVGVADFKSKLQSIGYDLAKIGEEKTKSSKLKVSFVLFVITMFITMPQMFGIMIIKNPLYFALIQAVFATIITILNFEYFKNGFISLVKLKPNMNSLVALGSTAAYIYGVYTIYLILLNQQLGNESELMKFTHNLYFETSITIIVLVAVGKYIEEKAKNKTVSAINDLVENAPKIATLVDGTLLKIEDLKVGDKILIKPGDVICADGKVVKGLSNVDESSITGEPLLKEVGLKSLVYNGTKNIDGVLEIEVLKENSDSSLQKVLNLIIEASNSKAKISTLADRISLIFVPIVMLLSIITFVTWFLITKDFELSFGFALSVLVISCPCALGLATPVAIMASIGLASKNGILIKSADYLEESKDVDVVVFDKTGTLTIGKPKLIDYVEFNELASQIIYSLEKSSTHPLSEAITTYFSDVDSLDFTEYENVAGYGMNASFDNKKYYFGSLRYLESMNILISKENRSVINKFFDESKTISFLFSNKLDAIVTFTDEIKPESKKAISKLKERNIKTVMLTGDNEKSAKMIADKLGIDEVKANLLPLDKSNIIKEIKESGKIVMMIGDGINDSVALINANVGVAVNNASDLAIENANVVIKENKLLDIINVINISKFSFKIIKENLFWAFFYNIIFIPISAGVLYSSFGLKLTPMIAIVLMSISSLFVVFNALRINKIKMIRNEENVMRAILSVNMSCKHCEKAVGNILDNLPNVISYEIKLEKKQVIVEYKDNLDLIIEKIKEQSYEVEVV